ncbi:unnamed protein product [Rotaria sp. Silwood2]|nr:unnamed protein product [Rotaria sp. Silwood2]CAF3353007.1 unnamed protein product [Rotaria sp. Silwood2]CAF4220472.1 unnamed protein product [Rotaria sp. Silwood2]CAF4379877.1 unnamed protein product [Rotaria sp. Silwood2]
MATVTQHLTIGLQYARNYDYAKAETEFDLLLSSDRTNVLGLYYRGCTRIHLNKFELAVEDFNSAISSSNLSHEYELQALYKRGFAHQKLYQFNFALDNYRQFLNRTKEKSKNELIHKAYFSIGTIHAALNRNEQAVRHFGDAIRTSSGSMEDEQKVYYLHRGRAHAFCADFKAARDDLYIVIIESNNSFFKGCAYNELGQHDQALQQFNLFYESQLRNNNKSSSLVEILDDHARFRRGLSYASLNRHDNAIADYQRILDNSNRSTSSTIADRIFFRKGMSSMALNDVHDALINFNKSISFNNHQSDVFYARGMLHFTLGRHDAAVNDHRHALELGEANSIVPSIYQTFYHTHKYNRDDVNSHVFHQKKLREAETALKHCKEQGLSLEEPHRQIAEHQQQFAPYTHDPEKTHHLAQKHIQEALSFSTTRQMYDDITFAISKLYEAQILCDKYPGGVASERIVNQFVTSTMEGILKMSEIFQKCALETNWEDLLNTLYELNDISDTKSNNPFNLFRLTYVRIELNKAKMIQKTSEKFKDSPQQHEFCMLLVIRLCNLFDATRAATTGIFQHALTGTFTKVSYIPKLLGYICDFLPMGSEVVKSVFSICESGLKQLDEIRIQNALIHVGCLDNREKLNETADKISDKLTIMYKRQVQRFPASKDDPNIVKKNDEKKSCWCTKCCQSCCNCLKKSKNRILNEREASNIQNIVQYAFELLVNSLTELEVSEVNNTADLNSFFINSICHLSYLPKIYCHIALTKIQPKDAINDADYWNTYDFFRRPGVRFEENDIRADKYMDVKKFDYREPSWNEVRWYKNDQKKLDTLGFKKYNES